MTFRFAAAALALAGMAAATAASAKDDDKAPTPPAVYTAVTACKGVADSAARLACFDRTVAAMDSAQRGQDLVVTDRAAIREAQRGLFGLTLPKIKLFGGNSSDEVKEIVGKLRAVRQASDGSDVFVLEDGTRWRQTEGRNTFARVGDAIRVRRTGLGGYMANIRDQPGVRVFRLAD